MLVLISEIDDEYGVCTTSAQFTWQLKAAFAEERRIKLPSWLHRGSTLSIWRRGGQAVFEEVGL